MARLKSETTVAHKQLEKTSSFKRLFAEDYQMSEYAQLLANFYGYFAAIEEILFADIPQQYVGSLHYRAKTALLKQDLAALGVDVESLPLCNDLPPLGSFAQKMGVFYVLEGSTLGGRVIKRHLSQHFAAEVVPALHFYTGYGDHLDLEWQRFIALMLRAFSHEDELTDNAVIEAANATFSGLQRWFELCSLENVS